jgi:deoxycytidylate deaminase
MILTSSNVRSDDLQILFGFPFESPPVDEFCMFQARQRRSGLWAFQGKLGQLSRRQMARFVRPEATKCRIREEGQYGTHRLANQKNITETSESSMILRSEWRMNFERATEALGRCWLADDKEQIERDLLAQSAFFIGQSPPLRGSRAASVLEFGRVVHAEMSVITDSTRRGVGVKDATRYCTTFPCHKCARHIIAPGLAPVV